MKLFPALLEAQVVPDQESVICRGEIHQMEMKNEKTVVYLKHVVFENSIMLEGAICYIDDISVISDYKIGQTVLVKGTSKQFQNATNEGQFDAKKYYHTRGYEIAIYQAMIQSSSNTYKPYHNFLFQLKRKIAAYIELGLSPKDAGVLRSEERRVGKEC